LRRCARSIKRAVRSNSRRERTRPSTTSEINAETAVWTWHTVNSDFFPRKPLIGPRQETSS